MYARQVLTFLFCVFALLPAHPQQDTNGNDGHAVAVEMRNVAYHFTPGSVVSIATLRGALLPTSAGKIPVFDDKNSFVIRVDAAEIAVPVASLANVLNSYVFQRDDAPLKKISIRVDKDQLKISGRLHSKGDVPFETAGVLSATPEGHIRLHTEKIKALHVPVKGLMELLGLDLAQLMKTDKVAGVRVDKDDLILDPEQVFPPPHIRGKVTAVSIRGNDVVQVFGREEQKKPLVFSGNYMAYRGNQLRFGKLTMNNTDLVLIDMDPKDPFDFYLDHYQEQLVAGFTKITPAFGLRTYMRDFNKLRAKGTREHAKSD
jgi:hypothetical protein